MAGGIPDRGLPDRGWPDRGIPYAPGAAGGSRRNQNFAVLFSQVFSPGAFLNAMSELNKYLEGGN